MSSRKTLLRSGVLVVMLALFVVVSGHPLENQNHEADAARLNSLGVALMNQQLNEKAAAEFAEAHAADPEAVAPVLNRGIALIYMERLAEAEQELRQATLLAPDDPRSWYNLGLAQMDEAQQKAALGDFQHVLAIDPNDADAHYFAGQMEMSLGDLNGAIAQFEAALKLNPVHASAEFGLARALQRAGRQQEAHQHIQVFQRLVQTKVASPLALGYGDRGRLSTMEEMALPAEPVGAMIPVRFAAWPLAWPEANASHGAGSEGASAGGVCVMDLEAPGSQDLVVMGSGEHAIRAYRNLHDGKFEALTPSETGLDASGLGVACAVGDFDNDGKPDLAVAMAPEKAGVAGRVVLYRNLGGGKFEDVTAKTGIRAVNDPAGLTFVDFDHDGDLDLLVTGRAAGAAGSKAGPNVMWRNNGNSTFTDVTGAEGLANEGSTEQAELSDINNDRAVDLVVTGAGPAPVVYLNRREGAFAPMPLYPPQQAKTGLAGGPGIPDASLPGTRGVAVFDFNHDGWMDVAVTHAGAPGLTLWRNVEGTHFERVALPLPPGVTGGWGVTPIDFDNDGWIDLAAVLEVGGRTELHVFRNLGPRGFADVSAALGLDKLSLHDARSVIAADVDGDGAPDLIVTQARGPAMVLRNVGGNAHHALRLTLTGLADNKTGIGTKVEVLANGQWQKFEVAGGSGYLSQGSTEIEAGLGTTSHVDVIRLLWPTGVPQDEIDVDASHPVTLKELDRRGSSCPVLFAWDGKRYRFISDVIGAAVVGHWTAPGETNRNDPGEWIKVDGDALRASDGRLHRGAPGSSASGTPMLSLRFGEPMEEVNYIDQLRLVAVDHPVGIEVYPDEKFLSEPPFATGKAVAVSAPHTVAGAWDNDGRDVRALLAKQDHQYVRDFTNLSYAGFANLHSLTLDLGPWTPEHPLRLLLHGYIEYFSASSMYAASQAGLRPIPPRVDALMPDGKWKRILGDMGFPAGLPRTMVVDLTGKLPVGVRKIRITTNLQIYWDQALVDNGAEARGEVRETEVPLATAHLVFRGYPQQIEGKTPGDLTYNYERISRTGPFLWARGMYTRYGDVTPLLKKIDDEYVIFGTGEEIDAEFRASTLPPLPHGWTRDYFFYANGFVKDMDFWEAEPFTVGELPFHGMSRYPYPASEHFPDTPAMQQYLLNWDTRWESGEKLQRWEFEYRAQGSERRAQSAERRAQSAERRSQ